MKPGAVLATNTSSLKLEDLRTVLQRPERWSASISSTRWR
jgi:3-hydroxyacyl-CoA dehydrogenase/enoyl-CoA hydratase/3-hydroxybutyryl-CoA epimerase